MGACVSFFGYTWEPWGDGLWYGPPVQEPGTVLDLAVARGVLGVSSRSRGDTRFFLRPAAWEEIPVDALRVA